ncbi:protein LTO1 homolog isoform X3 [Patagioenas fasciata]|uniref:protein LTO1 homolog isoform X3 n=1 Tax=Patagioenas fasciata TaxID=372321 RepID=UPI003A999B55
MERSFRSNTKHLCKHALQRAAKLSVCYCVHPEISRNAFDPWRCTPWRRIRNKGRDPPLQQRTRAVLQAKDKMHLPPRPLDRVSVFPADFGLRPPASRQRDAFAGPSRFILATGKTRHNPATAKQSPDAT